MARPKKVVKTDEEIPAKITPNAGATSSPVTPEEVEVGEENTQDYLRQYQYKREMPLGHADSDPTGGKPLAMKNQLLGQSKVRVMIPVDSGSDPSVPFSVQLNGYRLDLPRNQYIDVPQQVAEVIMASHKQTLQALDMFKVSGDKRKEEALS